MGFNVNSPWQELASQANTPSTGAQFIYPKTDNFWYVKDDAGTETLLGGGGSTAPATATYILQTTNASLASAQVLASLVTGLMKVTTTTGVVSSVTTSAGLAALISDKTGSDALVFANTPTLVTPALGAATGTSIVLSGGMGLAGTALDANNTLVIDKNYGNIAATTRAMNITATMTLSGNNANVIAGAFFIATIDQATFNATSASGARAFSASARTIGASGTATGVVAILPSVVNSGAGTLTNAYDIQAASLSNSGGGTVTSHAVFVSNTQTAATNNTYLLLGTITIPSGNWGVYVSSANDNSFAGALGLAGNFTPTKTLGLSGQAARTIGSERHTTANTAGNSLTVNGGGATSGATDKNGGNLILVSGVSTGTGNSDFVVQTNPAGSTGTTDTTPTETFRVKGNGSIVVPVTITTPGTTGNQTINRAAGRVNIAAAGTSVTVTNSLVTASSIVIAVAATADAAARVTNVVPGAGSFVINTVACTAETAFNWWVVS